MVGKEVEEETSFLPSDPSFPRLSRSVQEKEVDHSRVSLAFSCLLRPAISLHRTRNVSREANEADEMKNYS